MHILLLSAYDALSHQYWRKGLIKHLPEYQWTILTLPARYFNWRIRGNSYSWAFSQQEVLSQQYDLIIATSMVDLSSLRGMVPSIASIPTIVYFHENQFAYPRNHASSRIEPQIVSFYSALCADGILFNSQFNQQSFYSGVEELLKKMPDHTPDVIPHLRGISSVLPVPIDETLLNNVSKQPGTVVWNHRWEYDKGPQQLLELLMTLPEKLHFTFHVVGQSFRQIPEEFTQIRCLLEQRSWLGHWGYIEDKQEYKELLARSQIVLSTACHDFQGLSVLEAVSSGALPVVPDGLAYTEFIPKNFRYQSIQDAAGLLQKLVEEDCPPVALDSLSWSSLKPKYRQHIIKFSNVN